MEKTFDLKHSENVIEITQIPEFSKCFVASSKSEPWSALKNENDTSQYNRPRSF